LHKNSIIKLFLEFRKLVFSIILFIVFPAFMFSQTNPDIQKSDSLNELIPIDATSVPINSNQSTDTLSESEKKIGLIDIKVIYSAIDSIVLSRDSKKVYLYKKAKIEYGDITLEADYIEYEQFAHLPMLETGWEKSADDLAKWLNQKVDASS